MDRLDGYLPQTPLQMGLTAAGATAAAFVLLRGILRRKQNLKGKVVLITGASSGIGEALAHEFMKAGCRLILAARSIDKLERLKLELVEMYKVDPSTVQPFFLDLEDHSSISGAVNGSKGLISLFGRIDVLINNAGIACLSKVIFMEMDIYKKIMDVNYIGQVALTKEIVKHMIENREGTIAAISSLQGKMAVPRGSAYGASKHALQCFCDSLRAETAKHNIHVLVVSPSYVKTNIGHASMDGSGKVANSPREEIEKGMSAEYCAQQIVQSVRSFDAELLLGPLHHRLMVYIRILFPSLYMYIMSKL